MSFKRIPEFFPPDARFLKVEDLVDPSLPRLAADVDWVYPIWNKELGFTLSLGILYHVKKQIVLDEYVLSPLRVHNVNNKDDLRELLMDNLMDYSDVKVKGGDNGSKEFIVLTPSKKEDALVLQAISATLLRLSLDCMPSHFYRLDNILPIFYKSLEQVGKATRIYKIDLCASKSTIPFHEVEENIMDLIGDSPANRLIGSIFHLPIIETNGKKGQMSSCGIPSVGEISKVLFHITLRYTLDTEFDIRFPGIPFRRYDSEAYIFLKEKELLDEKAVQRLLDELSLLGKMESIGPGDKPLLCCSDKWIYLDSDCQVKLCDYTGYKERE